MCISVKKIQRIKFDISQNSLIQKNAYRIRICMKTVFWYFFMPPALPHAEQLTSVVGAHGALAVVRVFRVNRDRTPQISESIDDTVRFLADPNTVVV